MIHYYGVTAQGEYHKKNGTVCQDAHDIVVISDDLAIGAVADGLGSELYTDIASDIAVKKAVDYCKKHIGEHEESDYPDLIKRSFKKALNCIVKRANDDKNDVDEYDTTLALAIFKNNTVYYGNSGDSGIVVLKDDGTYSPITEQQRDENGCVFPLCFEDKWVFGVENHVASILLATDGMFETLFPYLLKGEKTEIYVALAQFLMNGESLGFGRNPDEEIQNQMSEFVKNIDKTQVTDDKTVLMMYNDSAKVTRQPDEYYAVPDWTALKTKHDEEFKKAAYPNLHK